MRGKKTWLLFAGDDCTRDTPLHLLDLPRDPAHPNPASYQAERRALQEAYREARQRDGHLYHTAANDTDLDLKVERLRNELAELRRAFTLWQNKVLRAFTALFFLLSLIVGSVWWFGFRISEDARRVTREKIHAQLQTAAEKTHQAALAEADKAKGWEERERLRQAAERAHAARLFSIDELAASFAEIQGTARSTQVFDEMTRVLSEEGVDQALAYAATQRPGILEKVKARAAAAREKNRAELLPLLTSAQLYADRNQSAEATPLFADILALEPDWPDALHAHFWFLIIQGDHAFTHTTLAAALGHFEAAEAAVQRLLQLEPDAPRSQRDVSVSLNKLGDFLSSRGKPGDAEKALSHYERSLKVREDLLQANPQSAEAARDVSVSLNKLGDFLSSRGKPGDAEKALSHYERCNEVLERLLQANPQSAQAARDVSVSLEQAWGFSFEPR